MKIRRICLYAGPSSGKSTTSAWLFSELKARTVADQGSLKLELIQEYVKSWAYEHRKPVSYDQYLLMVTQMHWEDLPLRNGTDFIITDSPLLLGITYAKKYNTPGWQNMINIALEFEKTYPSLNIFLDRKDRAYVAHGRYQDINEAKEMDKLIRDMMDEHISNYITFPYTDRPGILKHVLNALDIK